MKRLTLVAALLLVSCASKPAPRPEPVVQIVEVAVPIPVACTPDIGPEPTYIDTDAALIAAADLFERVKLLLAGRDQRIARDEVKTAALEGCRRPPSVPPQSG